MQPIVGCLKYEFFKDFSTLEGVLFSTTDPSPS